MKLQGCTEVFSFASGSENVFISEARGTCNDLASKLFVIPSQGDEKSQHLHERLWNKLGRQNKTLGFRRQHRAVDGFSYFDQDLNICEMAAHKIAWWSLAKLISEFARA